MELKEVLQEALRAIKPKSKELPAHVTKTLSQLQTALTKKKVKATCFLGGSFAKGTYLSNDFDVDIFVQFDRKTYLKADISKILKTTLKEFKPTSLHGSRDYFQFSKASIRYEVVPVIKIKKASESLNVTDFSPLHVSWVSKRIKKLHDDIRLAKQFFKAAGVYGAESYIRGFSGHVIDMLVIIHKGFIPLLKAASRWKPPVVLDFGQVHKGKALEHLNPSKTQSPLIVIDPIQPDRNASASLSQEKFARLVIAASSFLNNPSTRAFTIHEPDITQLQKIGPTIIARAQPVKGKNDVVGSKLLQVYDYIGSQLEEFGISRKEWHWEPSKPALFYFVLKTTLLSQTKTILGPPASLTQHAEAFKRKHPLATDWKKRLISIEPRTNRTPQEVLSNVLTSDYITARVKNISIQWPQPHS